MGLDGWLLALCLARACTMAVFMSYAAVLPVLMTAWSMSATRAGSVSTGFQAGYAVSLLVCSALADRLGARRVFLWSSWLTALAAVLFAVFARSYASGLVLYALVAVASGGTYTTAIMLLADRYPPSRRGAAVGWLIASSSLGYALSLLLSGSALAWGGYPAAFAASACGPVLGAVIVAFVLRGTPNLVHARQPESGFVSAVLKNRRAVRLIAGYTFHSWELLGMWAWAPAFLSAAFGAGGAAALRAVELGAYVSASFHVVGLLASSSMGGLSDRLGRRSVLLALAALGAGCSFAFGWLIGVPIALLLAVGALYAFAALGDSPVLSTAFTESVPPAYLGAGLAVRSLLGFGAGAIAPLAFGAVLDATNPSGVPPATWGWAFVSLGLGGAGAAWAAFGLARDRAPASLPMPRALR